ncbi:unnamed protein product [Amoebophrya sp. A120]|nr:unnamed protein product [Amoebophrya sp. A120]|eukprot:GSA120T00023857001.1
MAFSKNVAILNCYIFFLFMRNCNQDPHDKAASHYKFSKSPTIFCAKSVMQDAQGPLFHFCCRSRITTLVLRM